MQELVVLRLRTPRPPPLHPAEFRLPALRSQGFHRVRAPRDSDATTHTSSGALHPGMRDTREGAAETSSTIPNPAKPPITERRSNYLQMKLRESREENQDLEAENASLRALLQDLSLPTPEDLKTYQLQNDTMAAVVDGMLFKERMTEVVRLVLYTELDEFLEMRFSKGAKFKDEAIEEVRERLKAHVQGGRGSSTNKPELKHGR